MAAGAMAALTLVGAGTASAQGISALYVAQDGTGSCDSVTDPCGAISEALAQAAPGATIYVSGTIAENVRIDQDVTISGAYPGGQPAVISGLGTTSVITISGGTVALYDLTITNGDSVTVGGGINNNGGAVSVTDSIVAANQAEIGGGIVNLAGSVAVTDSIVANNLGGVDIGGIGNLASGAVSVADSSITGNDGGLDGGGIEESGNAGPFTVTDSTISANSASFGGGIADAGSGGSLTVLASTIAGNDGGFGSQVYFDQSFSIGASILSGTSGANGQCDATISPDDLGYNLSDDPSNTCRFSASSDGLGRNAQLGPLGFDAGDSTETLDPQAGSPAIGAIPDPTTLNGAQVCGGTASDQNGQSRPIQAGAGCTIGAVEEPLATYPVVVTGSQTYGSSSPSFTTVTAPPPGNSFSTSGLTCSTVNDHTTIGPTLQAGGTYTIDGSNCSGLSLTGPAASAYSITYTGSTFTVNQAPLTVDAPSASAQYGNVPATFTPTYSGLVDGQTAPSTPATCASPETDTSPPGTYSNAIACSGASDSNYRISNGPPGTLTITRALTTLTAAPARKRLLSITLSATLTRTGGGALSDQVVLFSVRGRKVCRATTTSSGVASCTVLRPLVAFGATTYTASYSGSTDYQASSSTGAL